jgi:transcription elongation factor
MLHTQVIGKGKNTRIKVMPFEEDFGGELCELEPDQIAKYFREGAHIRVIEGTYTGETGTIVKYVLQLFVYLVFIDPA